MNITRQYNTIVASISFSILFLFAQISNAQNLNQVWADEFNGSSIDNSIWNYEYGTANDNVHYFTDREENSKIVDGKLQIIAQEESYQGFNYTSALLKTQHAISWKFGRIEARIKLPGSNGFVPAFWMLPENDIYGWWASSGEIDILEHPTNEVNKIYGTVHTQAYNSFTGSGPRGGIISIPDAETEFHVYAIEWTEEKIDFFVDDQKYFTFNNENSGFEAWPFDQSFYIILSMGVGGGWVGSPDESTIFPAIMEVDYVRVYQDLIDIQISGEDNLPRYTEASTYFLPNIEGANYLWNVTGDAEIVSGQNTSNITIDWKIFSGNVEAEMTINNLAYSYNYPVIVSNNLLKNFGFENGVGHWYKTRPYPGDIEFKLQSVDPHTGNNCLSVDVKTESLNPWDIQLFQRDLNIEAEKHYYASFWAKTKSPGTKINAAIINSSNFVPFALKEILLTDVWTKYDLEFSPSSSFTGQFNIDMGGHIGDYYFDDFVLSLPELNDSNQITNADFSNDETGWIFITLGSAQATKKVENGEYAISISNGGANLWDIHLGQTNLSIEKDKEYVVSFDAYADEPRTISALVGQNSEPWTVYSGDQMFNLTTERQTYTYTFIMTNQTDNNARLGFDLGTSSIDLYFDNISLSKGNIPTGVESVNPTLTKSILLYQNYPNPFNPSTTISFSLPEFSNVKLGVYNLLGELVAELVNEKMNAGTYRVTWDGDNFTSGIYLVYLQSYSKVLTKKIILLK